MNKDKQVKEISEKIELLSKTMEDGMPTITMPMYSYEADKERANRREKKLINAVIGLSITVLIIFLSLAVMLFSCDIKTNTYSQDGDGNNLIGTGNEVVENWDNGTEQ